MKPSTAAPAEMSLSVVIASYNAQSTISRCLRALEDQRAQESFEVIVVDSSEDGTADLIRREFPNVKLITSPERMFPGDARNMGVARARGDIIAFTDADCLVDEAWVRRVVEAHQRLQNPVIGGSVENGNPESYVGWAYYFSEFSQWMPGGWSCEMAEIPTTCLTLKRWIFDEYGPFLERTYCSDTAFNWKAAKGGHRPLFLPTLRVSHINITGLASFVRRKVFHGKCFARVRMSEQKFGRMMRIAYIVLCPLLPAILFGRVLRSVLRKRAHVWRFVVASPLVILGLAAWSCGECLGYLSTPYSPAT